MKLSDYLTEEEIKLLFMGMFESRYNLILGAGTSITSTNILRDNIPVTNQFISRALDEFSVPYKSLPDINRVFQTLSERSNDKYSSFGDFIRDTFTCERYDEIYDLLVNLRWAFIWNLNIDDCLEKSYRKNSNKITWGIRSYHFNDDFITGDSKEIKHIHLHGTVGKVKDDGENVIFSIQQYNEAVKKNDTWISVFNSYYLNAPTITIGATLHSESDLHKSLFETKKFNPRFPSIIVLPDLEEFDIAYYRNQLKLIPIAENGKDFVECLNREFFKFLADNSIEGVDVEHYLNPNQNEQYMLVNWKKLNLSKPSDNRRDIYKGYEPRWNDSLLSLISKREVCDKLFSYIKNEDNKRPILLTGDSFTGKTAILYFLSKMLINQQFDVYFFDSNSRNNGEFRTEELALWIKNCKDSVLIIDDSADLSDNLAHLLKNISEIKHKAQIIITTRNKRLDHTKSVLQEFNPKVESVDIRLDKKELRNLIKKLEENSSLGDFQGDDYPIIEKYFEQHKYNIFSAMASLGVENEGFEVRVAKEVQPLKLSKYRNLLIAIAIPNYLGLNLPLSSLPSITNLSPEQIEKIVKEKLSSILTLEDNSISCVHKYMSEYVLNEFSSEDILEVCSKISNEFSKYITVESRKYKTIYYRIVRSLMRFDNLLDILDNNKELSLKYYELIEAKYINNSRYWDQRSIAYSENHLFNEAISCANKSIKTETYVHPYSLNTLGKVLLQYVQYSLNEKNFWEQDEYQKACDALTSSYQESERVEEYQIKTFLHYSLQIAKNLLDENDYKIVKQNLNFWITKKLELKRALPSEKFKKINREIDNLIKILG